MNISFSVDFKVGGNERSAEKIIIEYVADMISKSIVLRELKVSVVKINGQEFNLEEIRKRDRRF